ncbi:MAG TPA: hypothetical protein VNQ52_01990 [Microbacteriaceae bacterium]|nr:hypothetical protein [Microbacteriaceae bacterium]
MRHLRLDSRALDAAAVRVEQVHADFAQVQLLAHDTAELTGHAGLVERVHEFADAWTRSRATLLARLERLAGALRTIDETFTRLELGLRDEAVRERAATAGGR